MEIYIYIHALPYVKPCETEFTFSTEVKHDYYPLNLLLLLTFLLLDLKKISSLDIYVAFHDTLYTMVPR